MLPHCLCLEIGGDPYDSQHMNVQFSCSTWGNYDRSWFARNGGTSPSGSFYTKKDQYLGDW